MRDEVSERERERERASEQREVKKKGGRREGHHAICAIWARRKDHYDETYTQFKDTSLTTNRIVDVVNWISFLVDTS